MEDNQPDLSRFQFPHLNDTDFPMLENVDVYEYENEFDYDRWNDADTKLHLCNVLWNNDYSNVVKFKNDQERDKYFDTIEGYKVDLETEFNITPDGVVKVPVPYQVATRYNYLYVDLPIMTSEEEPINYENPRRTQRYYYFINDAVQNAPNSTTLVVALDSWTTYINNVDIPYLMLERGHQPMSAIDVETYLSNPMQNNGLLLAPDFDFANGSDVVKSASFVPVNNGTKYILFATTMNMQQLMSQIYPPQIGKTNTPATFADAPMRNGYQYIVNDYDWGLGDYDYNGMYTETDSFQSANGSIPNNMTMVAVEAINADAMFAYMSQVVPFIYKTIKACFMVDDTMFEKGDSFKFCNVTCYAVKPAADSVLATLRFTKEDFGYSSKYDKIAKLYTSPYARIEVTDNNGTTKEFKIENTSNVEVHKATCIAFPYISIQAYINGINGSGFSTYTWKQLDNTELQKQMSSDDFGAFMWNWDIPTYALYVRGYDDFKASNYPQQFVARYNAIADYHKSVGMDNTQYENSKDSADTTQTMTNNSAATEYNNAVAMANTIKTNNDASATTARTNAIASSQTAHTNVNNQSNAAVANTRTDITRNTENMTYHVASQVKQVIANNGLNTANQAWDAGLTRATTDAENTQTIATGVANAVGAVGNTISSAASALGAGNPLGAIGAAVGGGTDIASAGITTIVACATNSAIAEATISNTAAKLGELNQNNTNIQNIASLEQNDITAENNVAATAITKTTTDMWNTNAANTDTTNQANANRTYNTSVANNARTQGTSVANAGRTQSNAVNNAALNRNTTVANSGYTRGTAVDNAKITLEQKRIANQQQYYTSRLSAPTQYGADSGDPTLDAFQRRGLQVKVRTQSDGNIAQAGDLMLRFGYALNQVVNVNVSGLCCMKHFTYWKASDIWINEGEGVNQGSQGDIQRAFEQGVTVWRDPEMIGKVSVYDNWK